LAPLTASEKDTSTDGFFSNDSASEQQAALFRSDREITSVRMGAFVIPVCSASTVMALPALG
jgi:hypothetical protein